MASFTDWARPDVSPYQVQENAAFRPANMPVFEVGDTMRYAEHEYTDRQMVRGFDTGLDDGNERAVEAAMQRGRGFSGVPSSLETRDDQWSSIMHPWVREHGMPSTLPEGFNSQDIFTTMDTTADTTADAGYRFPGNGPSVYKMDRIDYEGIQPAYQN